MVRIIFNMHFLVMLGSLLALVALLGIPVSGDGRLAVSGPC
jgi:hypothetical protein